MNSRSLVICERPSHAAATALLARAGLPISDLAGPDLQHFFYAGTAEAPIALVGLEMYERVALLRSLVVSAEARTSGVGTRLVAHAESHARGQAVRSMYLLTMTAEAFFAHRGYVRIERTDAPLSIRSTHEFASLCPANAAVMVKPL